MSKSLVPSTEIRHRYKYKYTLPVGCSFFDRMHRNLRTVTCTLQVCNTPKRYILKTIRTFCLALKAIFFKEVLNIKNSNFIKTPHLRHNQWPDDVIGESFSLLKSNCESTIFGSVIWPILIAFILQLRQQQQKMHVSLYVAAHDVILILVLNVIDI